MRCKSCDSVFDESYLKNGRCPCCEVYRNSNKDWSEQRVRCLECGAEFYENLIPVHDMLGEETEEEDLEEVCPVCVMPGMLMDI